MSRYIDADEFFKNFPELAIEPYIDAPTVEERPKGKWLSHYEYCAKHGCNPSALIAFWWCDQCEQAVEHPTNFCPNCGADMRMRKSNEDCMDEDAKQASIPYTYEVKKNEID